MQIDQLQEGIYRKLYKVKILENHDNPRAKELIENEEQLINWTAFQYFKRYNLVYAGQETEILMSSLLIKI